jgi:hypothetical protein
MTWGFELGGIKTNSVMRINEKCDWTETHDVSIGSQPAKRLMEVTARRQR